MDGSEIKLKEPFILELTTSYKFLHGGRFEYNGPPIIDLSHSFLIEAALLLQPEHFCKTIIPRYRNEWVCPTVYETKLGTKFSERNLNRYTISVLKLRKVRKVVNCTEIKIGYTGDIPLFSWDYDSKITNYTSNRINGKPTLEIIILNGEKYTNDWKNWPTEIKSFQL